MPWIGLITIVLNGIISSSLEAMINRMNAGFIISFIALVFMSSEIRLIFASPVPTPLSIPQVSTHPGLRFYNARNRESRFQEMYDGINEMKEVELDQRIAIAVRQDPFMVIQCLTTTYILLNTIVEQIVPEKLKPRIRLQSLASAIILHMIEIILRLEIPPDLANQGGIFLETDIITDARVGMRRIAGSREGQQIAYALVCILHGFPSGCVIPLLIRDLPSYLKNIGLGLLLCLPKFGNIGFFIDFFGNLYRRNNAEEEIENTGGKKIMGSDDTDESNNERKSTFKINMRNTRVLVDLVSESLSLIFETVLLIQAVTSLPLSGEEKINLFVIVQHIISSIFTFQYISVRGRDFGIFLKSVFKNTEILSVTQTSLREAVDVLKANSPVTLIKSLIGTAAIKKEKSPTRKKKNASKKSPKKKKVTVDIL